MTSKYFKENLYNLDPLQRQYFEQNPVQCPNEQMLRMYTLLKHDLLMIRLEQMTRKELHKQISGVLSVDLRVFMEDSGFMEVLKSSVIKLCEKKSSVEKVYSIMSISRRAVDEPIDSIRLARVAWEDGINEELHTICNESNRRFTLFRSVGERNIFLDQNLSQSGSMDAVKFLFDSEDLLETGVAIRNYNCRRNHVERGIGLINLSLKVLSFSEIATRYAELISSNMPQLGMDELTVQYGSKLSSLRHEDMELICSTGCMLDARLFLRRGAPPSLRGKIWRVALGLCEENVAFEDVVFHKLRRDCDRSDLLSDELFLHDIQTVVDDPRFFVFEEELKEVIFCFSRDEWVRHNCQYEIHRPIFILSQDGDDNVSSPPCGMQPFLGFATYIAPLCYVFRNKSSLYSVSRTLFCRLWCKLNVLTSDDDTLLTICKTFETLLLQSNPKLFLHLVSLGLQPLKIAFPWIQLGFVNLLEMDQVLHLWDRVIGFMDPLLLAIAAVAVFVYRAEALLNCNSLLDAATVINEGSRLCIIPIIQMLFYKD